MSIATTSSVKSKLQQYSDRLTLKPAPIVAAGVVVRIVGLTVEVKGTQMPIGGSCHIETDCGMRISAEVVGFADDLVYIMPFAETFGIHPGARVVPTGELANVEVGDHFIGRVLTPNGEPLDGRPLQGLTETRPILGQPINPLSRTSIEAPLDVGIRSINALLTVGRGQRLGIFAGSGIGKSILLGMMARYTTADVIVIGLIGERGREVQAFIESNLGEDGMKRTVVVASPADDSPLLRYRGALFATSIAEYFRDQGKDVLLLIDSLTRFAHAQREIALAVGEPPAAKGYTPSVFAKLPKLIERAGTDAQSSGSITAFYTVLCESDDHLEPIADAAKSILDGHIVLSRTLAEQGYYPAIDIEHSISRVMPNLTSASQQQLALLFKKIYSIYQQNHDLIKVGAYSVGSDAELDLAVKLYPAMLGFIAQQHGETVTLDDAFSALSQLLATDNLVMTTDDGEQDAN